MLRSEKIIAVQIASLNNSKLDRSRAFGRRLHQREQFVEQALGGRTHARPSSIDALVAYAGILAFISSRNSVMNLNGDPPPGWPCAQPGLQQTTDRRSGVRSIHPTSRSGSVKTKLRSPMGERSAATSPRDRSSAIGMITSRETASTRPTEGARAPIAGWRAEPSEKLRHGTRFDRVDDHETARQRHTGKTGQH